MEAVSDNLMWTVLLQPETGRLYAPAGRRWIFPKPRDGASAPDDWTIFGWDSFFNALALATASGRLAWDVLLAGPRVALSEREPAQLAEPARRHAGPLSGPRSGRSRR